ncbi:MAG TPA: helix-turn-helix domain-containing protein [Sphingobium sp.]|nr:helix-turn-helix domain-containing protein [Sphingobium sp.]
MQGGYGIDRTATGKKRQMNDPGRPGRKAEQSAPDKIIDTAERLIGLHGFDAVSLRQISEAAGQRNNYAVQYHFGDVAGLLRAIRMKRVPEVEARRAEMLAEAERDGRTGDTRALIDVLFLPLIDYRDQNGERSFARFVFAMHGSPEAMRISGGIFEGMPAAGRTFGYLQTANPGIPMHLMLERLRLVAIMVLSSIFRRLAPFDSAVDDAALVDDVLEMASAALIAPVSAALKCRG